MPLQPSSTELLATINALAGESDEDSTSIIRESRALSTQVTIGQSRFLGSRGYCSELDYKRGCIADRQIMYHAHIGMNDADATVTALQSIDHAARQGNYCIDRAGFALDRRMGLPPERRDSLPAETGPILASDGDWRAFAHCADIQPHMGDFMIGQPASLTNTAHALRAGCTTIGNLSQFFTFEAPGWYDTLSTTRNTTQAIALLGALREHGTLLHSYLEDGYGALFKDCATVAAWAYLEKYIVEDLLGAKLAHCIGGLTSDPIKRAGWIFALDNIHDGDCIGSMFYGDTISFTTDFSHNRGVVAEYLLWDILAQMRCPTGHAVLPLPVTEAVRIPSAEEIADAQNLGRRIESSARRLYPHIDFSAAQHFADGICASGKQIFDTALAGLAHSAVDIRNPLQLLYVLKKLGAAAFEQLFGNDSPRYPTDMYTLSTRVIEDYRPFFTSAENRALMQDRRLLLASTDVHEHAIGALAQLLSEAGAAVINLGAEQNPEQIVSALRDHKIDALLVSTHNGMALEYARQLKSEMAKARLQIPVVFGGVLNQKVDDVALPVSVIEELAELGFHPALALPNLPHLLLPRM